MINVMKAVQNNAFKLLITLLLSIMVLYTYATIAFHDDKFRGKYTMEDTAVACQTMWDCLRIHMYYGLLYSPIWTKTMIDTDADDVVIDAFHNVPDDAGLFVLSYTILVNLVLTAIVSGIIIDSFSEMRQKNDEIRDDMIERCFICGIEREAFETLGLSFATHIKQDHNMWKYLWFRIHLDTKDSTDYTGQEQYVQKLINAKKTTFFPIKKAMAIEGRGNVKKDMLGLFAKVEAVGQQQMFLGKSLISQDDALEKLTNDVGNLTAELVSLKSVLMQNLGGSVR
jgi:hypothetical protein